MTEVIAALAIASVVLFTGPSRLSGIPRLGHRWLVSLAVGAEAIVVVFRPTSGVLVGMAIAAVMAWWWLRVRRLAVAQSRRTARQVQVACTELADDLRMGRIPADALQALAQSWPPLQAVATAADLHHDVPSALREVARMPGAAGLRDVAAAWQVAHRSGSGLATTLHHVAHLLAARERQARHVEAELAAARATALLVSGLPLAVLAMGAGIGANPWPVFNSGFGLVLLGMGGALVFLGWWWLDRLAEKAVTR